MKYFMLQILFVYVGDDHDYGNRNAAMRNIDPDCNLLTTDNFANIIILRTTLMTL